MSIEIIFGEKTDLNDPLANTVFDLADSCRTCLRHECSLTPTNSSDSDSIKFSDKLAACVSGMMWAKEYVPSLICGMCIDKLRIAYDFQTICLQSDRAFQLQGEAKKIRSESIAPDPKTTVDLAGCDETIGNVILSIKCEETQVQPLPQYAPDSLAAIQLEAAQSLDHSCKDGCQIWGIELCERIEGRINETCWQCSVCLKHFTTTADLSVHMRIHINDKQYACNSCEKSYSNEADLLMHIRSHTGESYCSYCDKKFSSRYMLNSRLKTHTCDRYWSCRICNKSCTTSSHLKQHMKTHTIGFSCKLCGRKFRRSSLLNVHMKRHSGDKRWPSKNSRSATPDPAPTTGLAGCDEAIEKIMLTKQISEKIQCGPDTAAATQSEIMQTLDKPWKGCCLACGKKLWIEKNSHLKTHIGDKLLQCRVCNKSYRKPCHLTEHMMHHTGEKYSCKLCDKKFAHSSSLSAHMKRHTGDKLSRCQICNKSYTRHSHLTDHMKKHTGEKLSCSTCDKKFSSRQALNRHLKTHTGEND
ncbi:zinc-finger associated domain containing protein [Oryctes borbonicus]|uniref:Zinc-finger associated domain containing protein n=1 Tax=Oryctes borbonicus TaxID=1629725 RepID=A0A0T6AYI4_9SCAR|nr:zinc-finger associated domain containing protein [Oryctes borbonicus]